MKLEEFVAQSLSDVAAGVVSAQSANGPMKIGISSRAVVKQALPGLMQDTQGAFYTTVDFDIAVTVTTNSQGQAAIDVLGLKLGGGGSADEQTVSRIKFSVPMKFV